MAVASLVHYAGMPMNYRNEYQLNELKNCLHLAVGDGLVHDRLQQSVLNFIKSSFASIVHVNLHHVQNESFTKPVFNNSIQ